MLLTKPAHGLKLLWISDFSTYCIYCMVKSWLYGEKWNRVSLPPPPASISSLLSVFREHSVLHRQQTLALTINVESWNMNPTPRIRSILLVCVNLNNTRLSLYLHNFHEAGGVGGEKYTTHSFPSRRWQISTLPSSCKNWIHPSATHRFEDRSGSWSQSQLTFGERWGYNACQSIWHVETNKQSTCTSLDRGRKEERLERNPPTHATENMPTPTQEEGSWVTERRTAPVKISIQENFVVSYADMPKYCKQTEPGGLRLV